MTNDGLINSFRKGESEVLELKKSTAQMERALKAACAFLNHKGGTIYFGVSDGDGKIVGQEVSDSTLKSISQKIRQRIKPEISPEIRALELEGKDVIEVKIIGVGNKPYYLDGVAYKRAGSENPIIAPDELERIILEKKKVHWDSEICEGANFNDIDEMKVKEFLKNAKTERNFDVAEEAVGDALERLELVKNGKLTNAAILLFGKNPQKFFLQSKIRCARYKGNTPIDFIDMKLIEGNAIDQVDDAEKFMLSHIKKAAKIVMFKREEVWEYPPDALREAIVNAVCHRDYSSTSDITIGIFDDRIEISDPGKLPEPLTPEDLKKTHKSVPRNPLVANAFFLIRNIEQWGKGTNKIVEWCVGHGLKEPDFREIAGGFLVTFYAPSDILSLVPQPAKTDLKELGLNERQIGSLTLMVNEKKTFTIADYAEKFKVNEKTARRDLKRLADMDFVEKVGATKNAYFKAR